MPGQRPFQPICHFPKAPRLYLSVVYVRGEPSPLILEAVFTQSVLEYHGELLGESADSGSVDSRLRIPDEELRLALP